MYCYYTANAGWTTTQVVDDIAALCTGAAVSALSASCNKPASYQTGSTISAGWTLHDADTAQATKGVVLSCSDADALSTKYMNLWGSGAVMQIRSLESWDATNNTTVNASSVPTGHTWGTVGVAFSVHVFCTPQYFWMGRADSDNALMCFEVLRDTPYLASASPMPLTCIVGYITTFHAANNDFRLPRLRNPRTGATLLTTSAGFTPMGIGPRYMNATTGVVQVNQTTPTLDSGGNSFHQVTPMLWGWQDGAYPNMVYHGRTAMNSSGHGPCYTRTSISSAASGDTMVIDGQNYMLVSTGYGLLLPIM